MRGYLPLIISWMYFNTTKGFIGSSALLRAPTVIRFSPKPSDDETVIDPTPFSFVNAVNGLTKPIQQLLDDNTGGWALSYADLSPDSSKTTAGQLFLATNLAYLAVGASLQLQGEPLLGSLCDICAAASFAYHYTQLDLTAAEVRIALLVDYLFAALAIGTSSLYLGSALIGGSIPIADLYTTIGVSVSSIVFLGLSWQYEYGKPYMFWHGLWHLASAASGYLVGVVQLSN